MLLKVGLLPFKVASALSLTTFVTGYLGELTLTIPWSDLANSPVRVNVKDLFVLAGPKAESEVRCRFLPIVCLQPVYNTCRQYDPILEQERLQRQKMDKLEIFDSIMANRDVTGAIRRWIKAD